jgi:SlyX protein
MSDQRLIELETKISFQEVLIDDLQKVVNDQYHALEKIEKTIKQLEAKITATSEFTPPKNEKPPHY